MAFQKGHKGYLLYHTKCHYQITFKRPMPENIKGWGHNLLQKEVF